MAKKSQEYLKKFWKFFIGLYVRQEVSDKRGMLKKGDIWVETREEGGCETWPSLHLTSCRCTGVEWGEPSRSGLWKQGVDPQTG